MELIDNINRLLGDDLRQMLMPGAVGAQLTPERGAVTCALRVP